MKSIYELIETRRTVHSYKPQPVDPGLLEKIVRAGHFAPNHKLTWPWRFTLVGPTHRELLAKIAVAIKEEKQELSDEKRQRICEKVLNPAGLVVVSQIKTADAFRAKEDYAAVACAIQNIHLAAHFEGLGAKWSTGGLTRDQRTYDVVGIDSGDEEIVGFVWIGVPNTVPTIKRPDYETVLRRLD